jgi:hypothetical protein
VDVEVLEPAALPTGRERSPLWFRSALGLTVLAGVGARVAFVSLVSLPGEGLASDAVFYRTTATNLARGLGYAVPSHSHPNQLVVTAAHPPLFSGLLAAFDLLGIQSIMAQRLALAVVTSIAILVMGLLGQRVAGPMVGVVAAAIAAFDPIWMQPAGALMSESIYLIVIPLMLLQVLRCLEKPTTGRFVVVGISMACAILTRSDALGFIVLLGLPLAILGAARWRDRGKLGVALLVGLVLMLGPWLVRNEVQLGGAVLSDQQGDTLAGSYCTNTFDSGSPSYGSFDGACAVGAASVTVVYGKPPNGARHWTELSLDNELTQEAEHYARQHLSALPRVVAAREASTWGLGNHAFQLDLAEVEGRNGSYEQAGWIMYWVMSPFVVIGAVVLARRSRRLLAILLVPIVLVALNSAVVYGSTRLRTAAEPSLALLAALGGVAVVTQIMSSVRGRRASPTVPGAPAHSA